MPLQVTDISEGLRRSRKTITQIFLAQVFFLLLTFACLVAINATECVSFKTEDQRVILNSALFGFAGCIVYFSRKSYVYLITSKFQRMVQEEAAATHQADGETVLNIMRGYYLYMSLRPFVGLIIGPLIYMLVFTGLITFMKIPAPIDAELSRSGRYLIYFLSFVGGHASSDILDYFSKLAKKIRITTTSSS